MDDWRTIARQQHGVIRRGTGGLSRTQLDRELRTGALTAGGRHALIVTAAPASQEQALWVTASEIGPPMAFSGLTALWLYGLPVAAVPERPEVLIPRHRRTGAIERARLRRVVPRELARRRSVRGLAVVSVPVALRRAARELPFAEHTALVEHALRLRLTTEEQLHRALGHGLVGARVLREALTVTSPESHSLWERRLAWLLRRAGLPRPRRQVRLGSQPAYWVDFLFEPWRVAIEVDGFAVHARPDGFVAGLRRTRRLRVLHGIDVFGFAPIEIRDDGAAVVSEIAEILASRGAPVSRAARRRIS